MDFSSFSQLCPSVFPTLDPSCSTPHPLSFMFPPSIHLQWLFTLLNEIHVSSLSSPCYLVYWLVFCVNLTLAGVITDKGNASMKSSCKALSQLVIKGGRAPCGWSHLWAGSVGFYKKASWGSQRKQASKKCPSTASVSAPASEPAWVPAWLPWWWTAIWKCKLNKPFPSQLASWSWCLCRNRNPD